MAGWGWVLGGGSVSSWDQLLEVFLQARDEGLERGPVPPAPVPWVSLIRRIPPACRVHAPPPPLVPTLVQSFSLLERRHKQTV